MVTCPWLTPAFALARHGAALPSLSIPECGDGEGARFGGMAPSVRTFGESCTGLQPRRPFAGIPEIKPAG